MSAADRLRTVYDAFSRRSRGSSQTEVTLAISVTFRNRVLLFWRDYIGGSSVVTDPYDHDPSLVSFWGEMHNVLQHLYGRPQLSNSGRSHDFERDLLEFLGTCSDENFFDFMEMSFKLPASIRLIFRANDIVDAMNGMFRIEDLPYRMTRLIVREEPDHRASRLGPPLPPNESIIVAYPQIIRVDEQVSHKEAIQPALEVLGAPHFTQSNRDFLKALKHYRDGEYADCLMACGTTMESTLKVLCNRNKWPYRQTDTLNTLLDIVVPQTSLEPFFQQPLMLIGTMRNRLSSAHGSGTRSISVPSHLAQFALTNTASAVILLVKEADR